MNIFFITCARYPTQKAYGVTTGNTLKSLTDFGVANSILSWGKNSPDEFENKVISIALSPIRIPPKLYNSSLRAIAKLSFVLNQFIYALYLVFSKNIFSKESVLWTREPTTLFIHSILSFRSCYLIELHHSVSTFTRLMILFLNVKNNVHIITISDEAAEDFSRKFSAIKVSTLPMGVPKSFSCITKEISSDQFLVGYLGKGVSNGNDNELAEIVHTAKLLQDYKDIGFIFLGLEQEYKKNLQKIISDLKVDPSRITFIDHLEHKQVPRELIKFDVGVLPYPDSVYNSERFPIKILEYAAVGLPIIASDTAVHRRLLDQKFTLFYKKGLPSQLSEAILKIKENPEVSADMSASARLFSLNYTYDERARRLIYLLKQEYK